MCIRKEKNYIKSKRSLLFSNLKPVTTTPIRKIKFYSVSQRQATIEDQNITKLH